MSSSEFMKLEKFDPQDLRGPSFVDWKASITMYIYAQNGLAVYLDQAAVPAPEVIALEAETSLATRRETHRQNGVKAAFIIRQHVAQSISSQLPITLVGLCDDAANI
ncbi:hypothetical protein SmJEL517_g05088 [Synchytrium microbalum]|uniref:Uncharacterized protein n=1 Tax=Synchytrium microbalum TaxID=1806994 RepID=A0A507C0M0_9FUNG|nr:uncharacterized protein SmJEL517_g05088 [Synchytrium microbalum]TPX31614.1 hypothetical protein SmJEL517_g05088 [Synchytrium microbalum]